LLATIRRNSFSNGIDAKKVQNAAIQLKKAHVEREWEECIQKSGSELKRKDSWKSSRTRKTGLSSD
jgi:hypothetical protein